MNIFITFSSRSFRKNKQWYLKLIGVVEECGTTIKYRWFDSLVPKVTQDTYNISNANLKDSDMLIADITHPSVGVGQQIQFANNNKIPTIIVYNENKTENHSKSLYSNYQSSHTRIIKYTDFSDLKHRLFNAINISKRPRLEKLNFVATQEIKRFLKDESRKRNISQSEVLRQIVINSMRKNHE